MRFADRVDAGRQLAKRLAEENVAQDAVVLGIPRGGVVVAAEVAKGLGLPLDIAVSAKIASPVSPEYAIGAVAPDGVVAASESEGLTAAEIEHLAGPAREKVSLYLSRIRGPREPLSLVGRDVILVDDGLATGLTALAATRWVKRAGAASVLLAIPVASSSAMHMLQTEADRVIALSVPVSFYAVGQFFERFDQTTDEEVRQLLAGA